MSENVVVELIPRRLIFGNPERVSLRISPDGEHLAWLAPRDGVLNVWVSPRGALDAGRPVTHDTGRGIRFFTWTYTNDRILYIQDKDGDENWRLYAVEVSSGTVRELTPMEGIQARVQQMSRHYPTEVLIGLNDRDPQWHDIHRLDITTGDRKLVFENNRFAEILTDDRFQLRQSSTVTPEGGVAIFRPSADDESGWAQTEAISAEDSMTTEPVGFDETGKTLYMKDSRGRDTAALYAVDYETGARQLLAEDDRSDVADVLRHPRTREIQAAAFVRERKDWRVLDPAVQEHLERLDGVARGEVGVADRTLDDRYWIAVYEPDNEPAVYYLYDKTSARAERLFSSRPALEGRPLVPMHSATIRTRDGLDMVVYYSLPHGTDSNGDGIPDAPLPTVLHAHGGPWARDYWGYDAIHQWLANRGYAVLSVNFRSSTGFGKAFLNAGDHEWGGKILEDQVDAVQWAQAQGIADPERTGIMGGSFGGYSVLAGLTRFPELYACGVDIVGPSNLITLLESVPE